ncbi:atrial natriuretic peptide receptor 1 isoform X2 [Eurytemora carolleeae]|uniref:atrial natriuretic peptide receptor 1 isoform X2 n=1 Tax=Eurytemora carolleeae TaxID=1294199 RepID=UPI000C77941A|nr:atrial natriuretic peptide receptor 1 isoform X2 [Eurytemora carolleeae]|eukprot:XP_023347812.1 atrial natriuretic peptide receptor 1-like isoform X2 [Eurytemora affinis]
MKTSLLILLSTGNLCFLVYPSIASWPNLIWPPNRVGREKYLFQVRVSVILPVSISNNIPKNTSLLPSLFRAGPGVLAGLQEADRRGLVSSVYFNISFRDSHCDNIYAPKTWTDAVVDGVDVLFGPSCEYGLAAVARQAKFYNVSLITAGGMALNYQYRKDRREDEFFLLTRTGYSFLDTAKAVSNMMEEFDWHRLVLLYRKGDHAEWTGELTCTHVMSAVVEEMKKRQVTIQEIKLDMTDTIYNHSVDMLRQRMPELNYSIFVMCANGDSIRDIMLGAEEIGILDTGQYVFINMDIMTGYPQTYRPWYSEQSTKEENKRAAKAFGSVLTVTAVLNRAKGWTNFAQEVKNTSKELFGYIDYEENNVFAANLHDAALLYAQALNETLEEEGEKGIRSGENITKRMKNRTIDGISGKVVMDWNGDRGAEYAILQLDVEKQVYQRVRSYKTLDSGEQVYENVLDFMWPKSKVPLDFPPCGFTGLTGACAPEEDEDGTQAIWPIMLVLTTTLVVVFFIGAVFVYRHYKAEAEIASMHWKITPDNIIPTKEMRSRFGSKSSIYKSISIDSLDCEESRKQTYVKTVFFKGNIVAHKHLYTKSINQNRSLLLELKRLKDVQHDNIVRFVGACLEPDCSFVLTEYCPRGSLQDILEDSGMHLDADFRFSLIYDIVKGLFFLHSSDLRIHGNLKSSNCVVDSRFAVKLTDFGLLSLRREENSDGTEDNEFWKRKLWTAPELLNTSGGSQKGDVYSFSIILHEIVVQQGTWGINFNCWSPQYIVRGVQVEFLRPSLDFDIEIEMVHLIERCWSQEPDQRPDISTIRNDVRKLNKISTSNNIMDNLMSRMERYANNLEGLVQERTQDYYDEKRKCEDLLYQLLPQSVANSLIEGRTVMAENFKSVTIYFSDIVGFTKISAESDPIQVVDLLNDLYTCFDSIIEHFDVYKVETIGDAYMVVSGLPKVHENHAQEIAGMSLSIIKSVGKFQIKHMPEERLKLRVGIHSGPCCAGVVGIKMPRYCLFGDTVNTASRMESNGLPLKIHVREENPTKFSIPKEPDCNSLPKPRNKNTNNQKFVNFENKKVFEIEREQDSDDYLSKLMPITKCGAEEICNFTRKKKTVNFSMNP